MKKVLSIIATISLVLGLSLFPATNPCYAHEHFWACKPVCALNHHKNPFESSVVLGIIYPDETVYDCGMDEVIRQKDLSGEYTLVWRAMTNQYGYCVEDLLRYLR